MKATLSFSLPEEQEEFQNAVDGSRNKYLIDEIWKEVFRPAEKHGYSGLHAQALNILLGFTEAHDSTNSSASALSIGASDARDLAGRLIEMLGERFHQVIADSK